MRIQWHPSDPPTSYPWNRRGLTIQARADVLAACQRQVDDDHRDLTRSADGLTRTQAEHLTELLARERVLGIERRRLASAPVAPDQRVSVTATLLRQLCAGDPDAIEKARAMIEVLEEK